jgi:hypothetical protein
MYKAYSICYNDYRVFFIGVINLHFGVLELYSQKLKQYYYIITSYDHVGNYDRKEGIGSQLLLSQQEYALLMTDHGANYNYCRTKDWDFSTFKDADLATRKLEALAVLNTLSS